MENALVQVDLTRAGRSKAGSVFAGLSIRLGELTFPHPQWTDFVVVVLSWWTEALIELVRGDIQSVEVRFMEGPFAMELQKVGPGALHLRLKEAGLKSSVRGEGTVRIALLIRTLLEASDSVLALCRERGWWSSDSEILSAAVARLRRESVSLVD